MIVIESFPLALVHAQLSSPFRFIATQVYMFSHAHSKWKDVDAIWTQIKGHIYILG